MHTHLHTHTPGCVLPLNLGWSFFLESYNHPLPNSLSSSFLGKPAFQTQVWYSPLWNFGSSFPPTTSFSFLGTYETSLLWVPLTLDCAYIRSCGKCCDNMVLFIYACLELRIELNTPWEVTKGWEGEGRQGGEEGREGLWGNKSWLAITASSILSIQVFICLASYSSSLFPTLAVMSKSLSILHLRTTSHATEGETLMTLRERGPSWGFPPNQWGSRIPRTWKNTLEAPQLRWLGGL